MKTWYTIADGKINYIAQRVDDKSPGDEWKEASNDWGGTPGDSIEWFDETMHRIHNDDLVTQGKRTDNRGRWYDTEEVGKYKDVNEYDTAAPENFTKEKPLENEPYQKWDKTKKKWVVDTEKKEKAEKEKEIGEKQSAIEEAERRIQRSTRAKLAGTATPEDDKYFIEINSEIDRLREEKQQLEMSA